MELNSGGTGVQRRCENEYYQPTSSCNGHISAPPPISASLASSQVMLQVQDPLWELLFQMILITVC